MGAVALPQISSRPIAVIGLLSPLICRDDRYCGSQQNKKIPPKRVAVAPDIPTIAESGLPGFELVAWQGVVAPAGTPRPVVEALAAQMAKLMADPATRDRLTKLTLEPLPPSTPDSFAAYIKTEVERWAVIVKNSGAELE
jgi:tripartite-type tricarboxylate transporter receptor subunit TctC